MKPIQYLRAKLIRNGERSRSRPAVLQQPTLQTTGNVYLQPSSQHNTDSTYTGHIPKQDLLTLTLILTLFSTKATSLTYSLPRRSRLRSRLTGPAPSPGVSSVYLDRPLLRESHAQPTPWWDSPNGTKDKGNRSKGKKTAVIAALFTTWGNTTHASGLWNLNSPDQTDRR